MPTRHDLQPLGAHGHENDEITPPPGGFVTSLGFFEDPAYTRADGTTVAYIGSVEDGDRIVACVNACEGIADPAAALAEIRATMSAVLDYLDGVNIHNLLTARARAALALLGEGGSPS